INDRIDVTTKAFLGLTVSCARCHDHKFDPIPTADYYSLYSVFANTVEPREEPWLHPMPRTPELTDYLAKMRAADQAKDAAEQQLAGLRRGRLPQEERAKTRRELMRQVA